MSVSEATANLNTLLKRLRDSHAEAAAPHLRVLPADATPDAARPFVPPSPTTIEPDEPLLGHLLMSLLLWENTTAKAEASLRKLEAAVVDFNELRHCMPDELAKVLGEKTPKVGERSLRLRTALNKLYAREHRMSLSHLHALPARDARLYLESLEGLPTYVAARVTLVGLGGHAAPVDSRICRRLVEAKVVAESATPDAAAAALEKKLKPADLPEAYALLQAWADEGAFAAAPSHLDAVPAVVRPVVDKAAREEARKRSKELARKRLKKPGKKTAAAKKKPGKRA